MIPDCIDSIFFIVIIIIITIIIITPFNLIKLTSCYYFHMELVKTPSSSMNTAMNDIINEEGKNNAATSNQVSKVGGSIVDDQDDQDPTAMKHVR